VRYVRLFGTQLQRSLALGMAYRFDFVTSGVVSLVWSVISIVPLYVAFHGRPAVGGWTYESSLVVFAWFTLLKGVLEGAVNPSLVQVVEHIRSGTLDFVLLKPADAQFLVSTARFEPWKLVDVAVALGLFGYAFSLIGRPPTPGAVALALVMLAAAVLVLYSIWILVVAAAFWVVRVDNLVYLFDSLFDFARWPSTVFKGAFAVVFTFVIPLALMTTFPARALLGTLSAEAALGAVVASAVATLAARRVWIRALAHYTSASS
jgi:ABC-2 type transport system permease protein